jgi:malonate decarboxylase epsilon subunit
MDCTLLFPGQGAQKVGMLHDLVSHPAVEETFGEISEALGYDIHTIDNTNSLRSTVFGQLALLAAGVATARALQRCGVQPIAVAGLSVGASAAAVVAESISLSDAARLVRSRAKQMETMYPNGYGLAAIVGLTESQVARIVGEVYNERRPVFLGNINAPKQIVTSGSVEGLNLVIGHALAEGARKAEILDIPVPSHCPLLQPIADSLREQLGSIAVNDPKTVYLANVTGRAVRTSEGVADDLANNIAHGVRWYDATCVAQELGTELFLQAPPGHILSDLAKDNLKDAEAYPITKDDFSRIIQLATS